VGKLAADALFYAIAIVSFELGRRVILPGGGAEPSLEAERDAASAIDDAPAERPSATPLPRPLERPLTSGARS